MRFDLNSKTNPDDPVSDNVAKAKNENDTYNKKLDQALAKRMNEKKEPYMQMNDVFIDTKLLNIKSENAKS